MDSPTTELPDRARPLAAPSDLHLRLPNVLDSVERARQALAALLATHAMPARVQYGIELVLEELLMNIVMHAYDGPGTGELELTAAVAPDRVVLRFEDRGRPFDPLARPDPPAPGTLDDAAVGGLGLALVRKAAQRMHYARVDGRNVLEVELARG